MTTAEKTTESQSDKFKEADREIEGDEDEAHRGDRLRKVVNYRPQPEKPE